MSQIPVWFERKFDFTLPAEQYPSVCIRLRGVPARIEEILRGVSRDVLVNRPADKWSAQEQPHAPCGSFVYSWPSTTTITWLESGR